MKNLTLLSATVLTATSALVFGTMPQKADAAGIVVGHDINTLGSAVAGIQEQTFAVNVANFLTSDSQTKNLLLFESNPGDPTRDFAPGVLAALNNAGFSVTVTSNYSTPFESFDAIFVAQDYPTVGFLDNTNLINFANAGGGIYLAGGVGDLFQGAPGEAASWSTFLNYFGLAFAPSYNPLNNVPITSNHPIFTGVTSLNSGQGQYIIDLGTNPNAEIVQSFGGQGVYAVVATSQPEQVPEPSTALGLLALGALGAGSTLLFQRK
jgi:hypothetical protein